MAILHARGWESYQPDDEPKPAMLEYQDALDKPFSMTWAAHGSKITVTFDTEMPEGEMLSIDFLLHARNKAGQTVALHVAGRWLHALIEAGLIEVEDGDEDESDEEDAP